MAGQIRQLLGSSERYCCCPAKGTTFAHGEEEVFDIYSTFTDHQNLSYAEVKTKLTAHFTPWRNKEYEIFRFRGERQKPHKVLDEYVARLRQLSKHCKFADVNAEIKSQVVQTCVLNKVKEKAFME